MDRIGSKRPRWFVKEWREYRGWTQEFLADRAEMTKSMISEIESGKKRLHDDLLGPLAFAFGIEVSDLLTNPNAPSRNELLKAGEAPRKIFEAVRDVSPEKQAEVLRWVTVILKNGTDG